MLSCRLEGACFDQVSSTVLREVKMNGLQASEKFNILKGIFDSHIAQKGSLRFRPAHTVRGNGQCVIGWFITLPSKCWTHGRTQGKTQGKDAGERRRENPQFPCSFPCSVHSPCESANHRSMIPLNARRGGAMLKLLQLSCNSAQYG
jgi:hypothetical protein